MNYVWIYVCPSKENNDEILIMENTNYILSLPNNKINYNESPENCAINELKKKTDFLPVSGTLPVIMGTITGLWGIIYCVKIIATKGMPNNREETERVFWYNWNVLSKDERLIPNLKLIIPLMMTGITDWTIKDEDCFTENKKHKIEVTI